jgi:hypothetical protein
MVLGKFAYCPIVRIFMRSYHHVIHPLLAQAILREEYTPWLYAYSSNAVIIVALNGGFRWLSAYPS